MRTYYFESDIGCGLRVFTNIRAAERGILKEAGTVNRPRVIAKATKQNIADVKAMGGHVPELL